jgi:hypothetical protein
LKVCRNHRIQPTPSDHRTPNEHRKKRKVVFAQIGRLTDKGAKMAYHINKIWVKDIGEI